ncbi:hypothetical protein [Actinomadura flavalba]|uniref:hypothetical protein n=1 Tax=Actinomadura flavalba TaxID=1120938 RepID=UPI00036EFCE3|nr:hypothetical protein [Actinomadura flavalba]
MTVRGGTSPEWTRPDQPLPRPQGEAPTFPDAPAGPPPAARPENWHRFHYPVGAFLVAFGVTSVAATGLAWSDRRAALADVVGAGLALPLLGLATAVQVLLVAAAVVALVRRRDFWFLPALALWTVGYGVFTAFSAINGEWGTLAVRVLYVLGFALLLALAYSLSVKARVGERRGPAAPASPRLTRTQEMALAALQRARPPARAPGPDAAHAPGAPVRDAAPPPHPAPSPASAPDRGAAHTPGPPSATAVDPGSARDRDAVPAPAPPGDAPAAGRTIVDAPQPRDAPGGGADTEATQAAPLPRPHRTAPLSLPERPGDTVFGEPRTRPDADGGPPAS